MGRRRLQCRKSRYRGCLPLLNQLLSYTSLVEQLDNKHTHEIHFLRTPRIKAHADEKNKNKNKNSEMKLWCLLEKVNPISLRVGHAVKTSGQRHDMALIMSYVELGIDQEGKSLSP